jgi:hypothetical protein
MDNHASWSGNLNAGLAAFTRRTRASYHPTNPNLAEFRLELYEQLEDAVKAEVDRLTVMLLDKMLAKGATQFGPLSARELIMALLLGEWIEI